MEASHRPYTRREERKLEKSSRQKLRRDDIALLIRKLEKLVCRDSEFKVSVLRVLQTAARTVIRIENESSDNNPMLAGVFSGYKKVESATIDFIRSVKFGPKTIKKYLEDTQQAFDSHHLMLTGKTEQPGLFPIRIITEKGPKGPEHGIIKEREKRDAERKGIHALRLFLMRNGLAGPISNPPFLGKQNVLEKVIAFIEKKQQEVTAVKTPHDQMMYSIGVKEGQKIAKSVAVKFIKNDPLLSFKCAELENYLDSHLTVASPTQLPDPNLLNLLPALKFSQIFGASNLFGFKSPNMSVAPISVMLPTGLFESAGSSSGASSSVTSLPNSMESSPRQSAVSEKIKVFRPWE